MPIRCPICQTTYSETPPNFCTACGWNLSDHITVNGSLEPGKDSHNIEWAKRVWGRKQAAELRAKQAESAIADRQNQIDDSQSRIELLTRRLERLNVEKNQVLESAKQREEERVFKLETEITQLQQNLQNTVTINDKLQTDLQNQLSDRQEQINLLKRRSQQITSEKEQTQETAHKLEAEILQLQQLLENTKLVNQQNQNNWQNQLSDKEEQIELLQRRLQQVNTEKEQAQQLGTKVDKLQRRLQVIETDNEQLETNLQNQQIQNNNLQKQLEDAKKQLKELTQRERMAQVALSQWIQSELFDQFIAEIATVTDPDEALDQIKQLQKKRLNKEWQNLPVHFLILQLVVDLLAKKPVSKDNLQAVLEDYHAILLVDAILTVRAELKYNRIIQRDGAGDYFHGL